MVEVRRPIILHVDDDEANRYAVSLILEKAGYDVVEAPDGATGLKLAQDLPDLIILDIRLPDMNGFDICRLIKADPKLSSIPVLQTSATFVLSEHKVEGLESGADGYLAQPIESAVLVATVRSLLRIRNAEREANDAKRSREETLAIVSHDLRNPLSAIMLQVKILSKSFDKGEKVVNVQEKLNRVTIACNRMNRLIQDLLDVSNIEGGKFSLSKTKFSMVYFINEVALSFEELAKQSEVEITKKILISDGRVEADKDRIIQVMGNIVSNSLKFTSPKGVITLTLNEDAENFIISVADTGGGIPAESLPHIFDRYWQGHKSRNAGVGLGLSIVQGIIKAHEGKVWAESKEGEGSTFTFTLPKKYSTQ